MTKNEEKIIARAIAGGNGTENAIGKVLAIIFKKLEVIEKGYKPYLTLKEACQYTGFSESHIRDLCNRRKLARCKPENGMGKAGRIFFKREDLDEYMSRNRIPAIDEIEVKTSDCVANHQMV